LLNRISLSSGVDVVKWSSGDDGISMQHADTPTPRDNGPAIVDAICTIDFPKLYVHKDVFSELQAIQRSQSSPKFDLRDIGSSAPCIVLAPLNATDLIKERMMKDSLARRQR
jgi:hypothetical protein